MKIFLALALVLSLLSSGVAQEGQAKKRLGHTPVKILPAPAGPVTQAEAKAIFSRITDNLPAIVEKPVTLKPTALTDSDQPVTHEQVVLELDRIYTAMKPSFKFTPRPVWYDASVFSIKAGPARTSLERLVREGYVARVGPLAASTGNLDVMDFGEAVGTFISRLAEVCHLPAVKFSPYLQP